MNLYLDVDGVINPMSHREPGDFRDWIDEEFFFWSPGMVARLGTLPVTKVWVTTHLNSANDLMVPKFGWEPLGVLERKREFMWWKLEAIGRVQSRDEPFVWIDDELSERREREGLIDMALAFYRAPMLLISPNRHTGISSSELDEIEGFVAHYG